MVPLPFLNPYRSTANSNSVFFLIRPSNMHTNCFSTWLSNVIPLYFPESCAFAFMELSIKFYAHVDDCVTRSFQFTISSNPLGAVAEWVRAFDWRPDCPGFESHCGKLFASELWQFRLPRFASVFRRRRH